MAEYITKEALKERFTKRLVWLKRDIHDKYSEGLYDGCEYDAHLIDEIPAADVAPVVHGRWIATHDEFCSCSLCKYPVHAAWSQTNYCPNCGAKMPGGTTDEL